MRRMIFRIVFLFSIAGVVFSTPAVFTYRLSNGLSVWVSPDHRSPLAVVQLWYRVGSKDEPKHLTGISHVLEHMMFKGTSTVSAKAFAHRIEQFGGVYNAMTSRDFTAYYAVIPREGLETVLALEADRMQHLQLKESDFLQEMQVVMEERRLRTDDNPQGRLYEAFSKAFFEGTPYAHPVVGWMKDLKDLRLPAVQQWYNQYYNPAHATLVVVGDVSPKQVRMMADKAFAGISSEPVRTPAFAGVTSGAGGTSGAGA